MMPIPDLQYYLLSDYVHLAFLAGVIISYLYFRPRHVSVGGSLAVGYLAAALFAPLNVIATIVVSLLAYAFIQGVILKLFLPRPRQIFAIGLGVGVLLDGIWMIIGDQILDESLRFTALRLVGVIVPGMLCNSFVKQGPRKTVGPLIVMVVIAGAIGAVGAYLINRLVAAPLSASLFEQSFGISFEMAFTLSAISVLLALVIQESTVKKSKLRTGGYVTAGVFVSAITHPVSLLVGFVSTAIVSVIWIYFSRRVPLFGKDRFFILVMLSMVTCSLLEIILNLTIGSTFDGPQNIVLMVLPAILVNDLTQYGLKRTAAGFSISAAVCAGVLGVSTAVS